MSIRKWDTQQDSKNTARQKTSVASSFWQREWAVS